MNPTITTWAPNPLEVGPIYPFTGSEAYLTIVLLAGWIAWHVWQIRNETALYGRAPKPGAVPRE